MEEKEQAAIAKKEESARWRARYRALGRTLKRRNLPEDEAEALLAVRGLVAERCMEEEDDSSWA